MNIASKVFNYFFTTQLVMAFLLLLMSGQNLWGQEVKWISFEAAVAQQAKDASPKKMFIDVYTDWCGWCKKMDKNTFQTDEVVEYVAQNYHAVKLDAESEDATSFDGQKLTYRQLSGGVFKVTGYPSIVLINSKKQVAVAPGYREKEGFIQMLEQFKEANQ